MATKRQIANARSRSIAAYSMRQSGYTTNEIALALGYQSHQVLNLLAVDRVHDLIQRVHLTTSHWPRFHAVDGMVRISPASLRTPASCTPARAGLYSRSIR